MTNKGIISRYWSAYGGFSALFSSAYFYLAIALSAFMFPAWLNNPWHELVLSVIPNILGFSLGGYALLVAIGDESFRALISGEVDGETSPYMEINASFVHFILMQFFSLMCALISSAYYFELNRSSFVYKFIQESELSLNTIVNTLNYFGYTIFIYALLTAVAATLSILRVSSWYDKFQTRKQTKG